MADFSRAVSINERKESIVITPRDNVATALEPLAAGQTIDANGQQRDGDANRLRAGTRLR